MPTVRNLSAGDIIPQMGFAPTQNQNGGWQAQRDYYMLASTWESSTTQLRFKRGTAITTADPSVSSTYSFLSVESKTAIYEDSGTVRLSVNYTGVGSAQFGGQDGDLLSLDALPTYRLEGRLRELPFAEHPKFRALGDEEQISLNSLMEGGYRWLATAVGSYTAGLYYDNGEDGLSRLPDEFQITSDDGKAFASRINKGLTTYQSPTYVWIESTQGNAGMTTAQLNALGKITTPRGNPPEAGGTRDWLLTSASQQQQGELYQTTIEWTLSEKDGWDSFLYSL